MSTATQIKQLQADLGNLRLYVETLYQKIGEIEQKMALQQASAQEEASRLDERISATNSQLGMSFGPILQEVMDQLRAELNVAIKNNISKIHSTIQEIQYKQQMHQATIMEE